MVTARRRAEQDAPIAISVLDGAALESAGAFNVASSRSSSRRCSSFDQPASPRSTSAASARPMASPTTASERGVGMATSTGLLQPHRRRPSTSSRRRPAPRSTRPGTLARATPPARQHHHARSFRAQGACRLSARQISASCRPGAISSSAAKSLAGRLAVSAAARRLVRSVASGRDVNAGQPRRARPAADRRWTFAGDYSHQNPDCCAQIYARVGATQRPLNRQYAALTAAFNYSPPSTDAFDRLTDLDATLRAEQELGGRLAARGWKLGDGAPTSVSAWRFWNWIPVERPRLHRPADHHQVEQPVEAGAVHAGVPRYAGATTASNTWWGCSASKRDLTTAGIREQGTAASRWLLNRPAPPPTTRRR